MSNLAASAIIFNADTQVIVADVEVKGLTIDEAIEKCRRTIDTLDSHFIYGLEVEQVGTPVDPDYRVGDLADLIYADWEERHLGE